MSPLSDYTFEQVKAALHRRDVSAEDVAASYLQAIAEWEPHVGAFVSISAERLASEARGADDRVRDGIPRPLEGIGFSVKDNIDVAGELTTAGSSWLAHRPAQSADCWRSLEAGGGMHVGKTSMHEFAFGATSVNAFSTTARNPWNPARIAGGSSGGSAVAVAVGACSASLGTDTGGSVRIPAALTGVTGFKPSSGAVPMRGVFPLSPSLDHVGVLSRTAAGCAEVFAHLSGSNVGHGDGNGSDEFGIHKLRIGLVTSHLAAAENSVRDVTERAVRVLEQLGARVEPVDIPYEAEVCRAGRTMVRFEAAQIHRSRLANADCVYGDDVRERLAEGLAVTAEAYRQARRERLRLVADISQELSDFDILAGPTTPITAPELDNCRHPDGGLVQSELLRNTYCYNVTGQPAISIPCGLSPDGLPVGLQLAAATGQDWLVLRVAMALQAASLWHQARPTGKAVLR